MYEVDFIGVGDSSSADAIGLRFTDPGNGSIAHVLIDGGWKADGPAVVEHLKQFYSGALDLVICTHPDGDHIGGLGEVIRECAVSNLWIHRPVTHGAPPEKGFAAAEELAELAAARGVKVHEPWAGESAFGGALLIAGPDHEYYLECLRNQTGTTAEAKALAHDLSLAERLVEAARRSADRVMAAMPIEVPFGDGDGANSRNNSSMVVSLTTGDRRFLFTADAGVPALERALDEIDSSDHSAHALGLFKLPHHGSRHNLDLATIERALGERTFKRRGCAMASLAPNSDASKYPSGRVSNACARRGFPVFHNRNGSAHYIGDGSTRTGTPLQPMPPLQEETD